MSNVTRIDKMVYGTSNGFEVLDLATGERRPFDLLSDDFHLADGLCFDQQYQLALCRSAAARAAGVATGIAA